MTSLVLNNLAHVCGNRKALTCPGTSKKSKPDLSSKNRLVQNHKYEVCIILSIIHCDV